MAKVVYVGPFDEVMVPAAGLGGVQPGEPVDVPDDVAESLLAQADNWAKPGTKAARERAEQHKAHREAFEKAVRAGTAGVDPKPADDAAAGDAAAAGEGAQA